MVLIGVDFHEATHTAVAIFITCAIVALGETMRRVAAATADAAEGMTAARERRVPDWQGR